MKWLHGYYSAAPRSLWPEHCVPAQENQVPVITTVLSRDRTASEPHKGSGFTPFSTSGTMPTTVKYHECLLECLMNGKVAFAPSFIS